MNLEIFLIRPLTSIKLTIKMLIGQRKQKGIFKQVERGLIAECYPNYGNVVRKGFHSNRAYNISILRKVKGTLIK